MHFTLQYCSYFAGVGGKGYMGERSPDRTHKYQYALSETQLIDHNRYTQCPHVPQKPTRGGRSMSLRQSRTDLSISFLLFLEKDRLQRMLHFNPNHSAVRLKVWRPIGGFGIYFYPYSLHVVFVEQFISRRRMISDRTSAP